MDYSISLKIVKKKIYSTLENLNMIIDIKCPHNAIHACNLHQIAVRFNGNPRGAIWALIGDARAYKNIAIFLDHPHTVFVDSDVMDVLLERLPLSTCEKRIERWFEK